jgi:hypothetical protein
MATEHPVFRPPADRNASLWRYMDFTKFIDLLERAQLFFARSDLLGDPFEGSLPPQHVAALSAVASQAGRPPAATTEVTRLQSVLRYLVFVSCWHMNQGESAAMWKHSAARRAASWVGGERMRTRGARGGRLRPSALAVELLQDLLDRAVGPAAPTTLLATTA